MANPAHNPPDCSGLSPASALWDKARDVVAYSLRTEGLSQPDVDAHASQVVQAMQKAGKLIGYGAAWDSTEDEYSACFADWRALANFAAWYAHQDAAARQDAAQKLSGGYSLKLDSYQAPWIATDGSFSAGGPFEVKMPHRNGRRANLRLYYGVMIGAAVTGVVLSIYNTFFRKHPAAEPTTTGKAIT